MKKPDKFVCNCGNDTFHIDKNTVKASIHPGHVRTECTKCTQGWKLGGSL